MLCLGELLALIAFVAGIPSCATGMPRQPHIGSSDELSAPPDENFEPVPLNQLIDLQPFSGTVRVTVNDGEPSQADYRIARHNDHWDSFVAGHTRVHFRRRPDGAIVVFREDDLIEQVRVDYEPAIVTLPATLRPGKLQEATVQMTVRHLDTGGHRDSGTCHYRVEAVEQRTIETPLGEMRAYILREHREIDLRMANATVDVELAYVPGRGQVAWEVSQQMRAALGLYASNAVKRFDRLPRSDEPARSQPAGK